jgi:predicted MPP superfamily phosphohydrolase
LTSSAKFRKRIVKLSLNFTAKYGYYSLMRWLFSFPLFFIGFFGICFYIGNNLFGFIRCFSPVTKVVFWPLFSLFFCAPLFVNFLPFRINFLHIIGSYWMAVFAYLFILLALSDFTRLVLFFAGKKIANINLYTVGAALLSCVILIVCGSLHARSVKTKNYSLALIGKSDDIRITLISDIHIGAAIGKSHVDRIVKAVNRTEPDLICISGDIFDGNLDVINDLEAVTDRLKLLKAPLGVYACLGNHDVDRMAISGGRTERITEILKKAGFTLLQDEVIQIRPDFFIAGRKDARPIGMSARRKSSKELLENIDGTIIMLDHQPVQFAQNEQAGVDLLLCGHTHRGQIFPVNIMTRFIYKKAGAVHYGYWKGQTMQAVVTSGAGFWGPPIRVGTNSEIAVININFVP